MDAPIPLAEYLLLFQVLCPFLAAFVTGVASSSSARRLSCLTGVALVCNSIAMCGGVLLQQHASPAAESLVLIQWELPFGTQASQGYFDDVVWGLDWESWWLVVLLPWVHLTAIRFNSDPHSTAKERSVVQRSSAELLMLGAATLLVVAQDFGSLMTAGSVGAAALAYLIAGQGRPNSRPGCTAFVRGQWIGWSLFAAAWAVAIGCVAVVGVAPYGLPGEVTSAIRLMFETLTGAVERHPAAGLAWRQYQLLPFLLFVAACGILTGGMPFQGWLVRAFGAGSVSARIWLVVWTKLGILLWVGVLRGFLWTDLAATLPGIVTWLVIGIWYSAGRLWFARDVDQSLCALLLWTGQAGLLGAIASLSSGTVLSGMLLTTIAAMVLGTVLHSVSRSENASQPAPDDPVSTPTQTWYQAAVLVVGVGVGLMPGIAGLALLWPIASSLSLSWGAASIGLPLIVIPVIVVAFGTICFCIRLDRNATLGAVRGRFRATDKLLLVIWSMITIAGPGIVFCFQF